MELVDKFDNKRQSLNKTTERQVKVEGEYRQSVHIWIQNSNRCYYCSFSACISVYKH